MRNQAENIVHFDLSRMSANAMKAEAFLKSIASAPRLMILCNLVTGEKTSGELAETLDLSPANASQHLARLRDEELVATRREGTTIYYSLHSEEVTAVMHLLYSLFCKEG